LSADVYGCLQHNLLTFHCETEKDKRYWVAKIKKAGTIATMAVADRHASYRCFPQIIVEFYTNGKNSDNLLRDWQSEKKSSTPYTLL